MNIFKKLVDIIGFGNRSAKIEGHLSKIEGLVKNIQDNLSVMERLSKNMVESQAESLPAISTPTDGIFKNGDTLTKTTTQISEIPTKNIFADFLDQNLSVDSLDDLSVANNTTLSGELNKGDVSLEADVGGRLEIRDFAMGGIKDLNIDTLIPKEAGKEDVSVKADNVSFETIWNVSDTTVFFNKIVIDLVEGKIRVRFDKLEEEVKTE